MSDDLIKRLREIRWRADLMHEAADRIEQLERDNHRWKMECEEFWRNREAKAMEALREIAGSVPYADNPWQIALSALAELEK